MSEVWYYANGSNRVGPISKNDLVQALSSMMDPAQTLVWRTGLSDWQTADKLPELAYYVAKPPPLPRSSSPHRFQPDNPALSVPVVSSSGTLKGSISVREALFSFRGRLNRTQYALVFIIAYLIPLITIGVIADNFEKQPLNLQILFWALLVYALWVFFASIVKRLHDTDQPGAYCLFMLIPAVGLITLLYVFFARGTPDTNKYGPPP
jgi:uncharacterized membrane protein YhaH (DUF805 family)